MLSYTDFTKYFGVILFDKEFQIFLRNTFSDLTEYDILESDYIRSELNGIELGFTNNEAIFDDDENVVIEKGQPVFSHFTLYPKSSATINRLPFSVDFGDERVRIIQKAEVPNQTKEGYADFLNKRFLVDNYKVNNIVITFDYDPEKQTLNFIQIRCNNLIEHLKL